MARVQWDGIGERRFEAGVDRGVLYVGSNPGVAWNGLTKVTHSQQGAEIKSRYLNGIRISNHTSPERFAGAIAAFSYPDEFEVCDGTKSLGFGLRAKQQVRKSFGLVYRTKVGNDLQDSSYAYKIHILYNLRAEPSERGYETLGDDTEPIEFSWKISAREERFEAALGIRPTAEFEIDSRDIPEALLTQLEDLLYGSPSNPPTLPSAGELIFMFDSFEDLVYDAGSPFTPVFSIHDAGDIDTAVVTTIDSGGV